VDGVADPLLPGCGVVVPWMVLGEGDGVSMGGFVCGGVLEADGLGLSSTVGPLAACADAGVMVMTVTTGAA